MCCAKACKRIVKWGGPVPDKCDLCGKPFDPERDRFFFDFRTLFGGWAVGCEVCFQEKGCGLGTGFGQQFDLRTLEKVAG